MEAFFNSQSSSRSRWSYDTLKNFREISPIVQNHIKRVIGNSFWVCKRLVSYCMCILNQFGCLIDFRFILRYVALWWLLLSEPFFMYCGTSVVFSLRWGLLEPWFGCYRHPPLKRFECDFTRFLLRKSYATLFSLIVLCFFSKRGCLC
ncbi:hypothetical protein V8G54_004355 [Vigna mungo]|uniref:Uncharacterized protein n=1 Tax=Vigna mungo TaxID=3915 RepID=A0AAQ3PBM2_VIGMU